jgi:hypothetical protein
LEGLARVREGLERGWREDIDGKSTDSYNSTFYRWISMIFGYVVLTHVVYIFTVGIFYISLRLRDTQGGNIWENTLLDNLLCCLFSPSATVGLGYSLDMLFFLILSRF